MNKRGIDDPESEAYEDDARALERELAAVVRRVLVEELEKPEFRRKLESTVAKEIRSQVGAQKRALREEGEAPRRTFESGGRAGQEEDLYGGERGPKPVDMAFRRDGYSRHRREEGFAWPRTFREWTPWLLGACLLLVVVWGVWFAVEKFRPQGSEAAPAEEALSDRGDPPDQASARTEDPTSTDPLGGIPEAPSAVAPEVLDEIWVREIRAAQAALAKGSPLLGSSPQEQLDCFFPQATRGALDRRAGRLDGDLSADFDRCVRAKFPLVKNAPNIPVFAAQTLARKLLVTQTSSGLTWCSNADLGAVQMSRFKPDGLTGPTTSTVLRAVASCLGAQGPTFDVQSPVEAYLAFSHAALGEIARLAPEGSTDR